MSNPTPTPAGWYDDSTGTNTERYWDGTQWTEQLRPAPAAATLTVQDPAAASVPVAPVYAAPGAPVAPTVPTERNVLGIVALAVAAVGFIFACIPGALIIGWVLLPIAFVLSIVALVLKGKGKALALTALIVSIVGTIIGFVVFFAVVANSFNEAFNTTPEVKPPAAQSSNAADSADTSKTSEAPAPAAKTGTRENPAAIGSDIVGNDFTVKINSVNLNGNDAVMAANQFNDAPDDGFMYAVINATITYTGADSSYAAQTEISYVGADGNVYNSFDKVVLAPEPALGLDELYNGASVTGNVVIQIPAAGDGLVRVSPGYFSDKVFVATK